jgi:CheY-like chemotaxis protein
MSSRCLLVLIVDDHHDSAESLTLLLRLWGYQTVEAHDGPAALAVAVAQRPDVILLDIGMPVVDGYEVARRLRELPATRDALIWALTGHGREEDRQRALEAGCDLHLVKPFPPALGCGERTRQPAVRSSNSERNDSPIPCNSRHPAKQGR